VLKALQGRTWSEVAKELGVGFEDALLKVKTAMRKLAERYYDVKETPSAGLTLNELTTS